MKKKMSKRNRFQNKIDGIMKIWRHKNEQIMTDDMGSYTGNPVYGTNPEQDADDL